MGFRGGISLVALDLIMLTGTGVRSPTLEWVREIILRYLLYGLKMRTGAVDRHPLVFLAD